MTIFNDLQQIADCAPNTMRVTAPTIICVFYVPFRLDSSLLGWQLRNRKMLIEVARSSVSEVQSSRTVESQSAERHVIRRLSRHCATCPAYGTKFGDIRLCQVGARRRLTMNEYPLTIVSIPSAYLRTLVCKHQLTINNRVAGGLGAGHLAPAA
jgi:hypothetical protein